MLLHNVGSLLVSMCKVRMCVWDMPCEAKGNPPPNVDNTVITTVLPTLLTQVGGIKIVQQEYFDKCTQPDTCYIVCGTIIDIVIECRKNLN